MAKIGFTGWVVLLAVLALNSTIGCDSAREQCHYGLAKFFTATVSW